MRAVAEVLGREAAGVSCEESRCSGGDDRPAHHQRQAEYIAHRYTTGIAVHVLSPDDARRVYGVTAPCALLVRPDGHVAHACSLTELHTVTAYLDRLYHRT